MRHLYLTKIRPIITYGCAIWFLRGPDVKWKLSDTLMRELESRQYQCLQHIAGAFKGISQQYLLKELHIEPLEVHLERCAMAFRARALASSPSTYTQRLKDLRPVAGNLRPSTLSNLWQHPYHVLDRPARQLQVKARERLLEGNEKTPKNTVRQDWENPKHRARAINAYARDLAERIASERCRLWQTEQQADRRKDQPALWSERKMENLWRYKNLTRAQSTILLQCRTGVGGFRAHLFRCKVRFQGRLAVIQ